jgi:hypothetical protein
MMGDNKSVVLNTSMPSSALKKKHNAVAYHRIREAIAGNILRFVHIPSNKNLADILTKPLTFNTIRIIINNHVTHIHSHSW